MPIDKSIRKYGINNFDFEIIEECPKEELNEREIYWIDYYNTYFGEGYNCTIGGDGASHAVKLSNVDVGNIISDLKQSELSILEIAKKYNVSKETILNINAGKSRIQNNELYPIRDTTVFSFKDVIDKNSLFNELNNTQGNIKKIAEKYGASEQTIRILCDTYNIPKTRISYGYVDYQEYHAKEICQCNLQKEIIHKYPSTREAARQLKINHNAIYRALHSKSHFSNGYLWYLSSEYQQPIRDACD